jgi:hypothetical protein
MSDFNRGIQYAFEYLKKNLIGRDVNGKMIGVLTGEQIDELYKKIPKKCGFCEKPCENSWCVTRNKEKNLCQKQY